MKFNGVLSLTFIGTIFLVSHASADDNVISNEVTIQNGGFNLDGADSLTIAETGEIKTSADNDYAISSTGDNNSIVLDGKLSTSGKKSNGATLRNGDGSSFTQSGSITTSGVNANGISIWSSTNSNVSQSGSISTSGNQAYGTILYFADDNNVTNSGNISTSGSTASAVVIWQSDANTVSQSGSLITSGSVARGISFNTSVNNSINQSGNIATSGADSDGIYLNNSDTNTFNLSGSISTSGSGADGIYLRSSSTNNIFNITGQITSSQANALLFSDNSTDNILNLTTGAVLGGAIDLGTGGNFVNIATTPGQSVVWDFGATSVITDGIQVSGTGAYLVDGNVFYSVDTTAQLNQANTLGDSTAMLSNIAASRFGAKTPATFEQPAGFAYMHDDGSVNFTDARFWGEFIGSTSSYGATGTSLGYKSYQYGLAFGYERDFDDAALFGVMGGYLGSRMNAENQLVTSQDIDGEGGFIGFYGARDMSDQIKLSISLTAGLINNKSSRSFNNSSVVPATNETATASYKSTFIAPSISISKDYVLDGQTTLTPTFSALYAYQWSDGYAETGSSANLTVGKGQSNMFEAKGELGITRQINANEQHKGGSITARLGAMVRATANKEAPTFSIAGIGTLTSASHDSDNLVAATAGLDFNFKVKDNVSLIASTDMAVGNNDYLSAQVKLGFKVKF